ncbi:DUF58 domain-containing protein [Thermodesulfobacteriota bacterium]
MIVPRSRLIFGVGIVFVPFATLATAVSSAALLSGAVSCVFFILVLLDAVLSLGRLKGIRVEIPEVVRLSLQKKAQIELRFTNDRMKIRRLRIGLAFPQEIFSARQEMIVNLPEDRSSSTLSWPFKALRRGRYVLEKCYLETASLFGFWSIRGVSAIRTEIRVYPNLMRGRENLASLFLNRSFGIHTQRQVGKGREFDHLREYLPGDSYEDIYWKVTAKRGFPVSKIYQIERTQELYIIIDASRLSTRTVQKANRGRGTPGSDEAEAFFTTILDRYITCALILGLAAERQGDLFGILSFSDRVREFLKAKNGKAHYNTCRDVLYTLAAQRVNPDFDELFTFIGSRIRRRALLVFLTNMDDPVTTESFLKNVNLISRRHLVLVNMIEPAEAKPLFSSPDVASSLDVYRHLGGHLLWEKLHETDKIMKRRGIGFSLLHHEKMSSQLISQYLSIKKRQLL